MGDSFIDDSLSLSLVRKGYRLSSFYGGLLVFKRTLALIGPKFTLEESGSPVRGTGSSDQKLSPLIMQLRSESALANVVKFGRGPKRPSRSTSAWAS